MMYGSVQQAAAVAVYLYCNIYRKPQLIRWLMKDLVSHAYILRIQCYFKIVAFNQTGLIVMLLLHLTY